MRAMLADLEREQDGLAAEGSLLRNNFMKMANELKSVAAKHNNVVRELSSNQDHLINKVLLLRNNAMEMADKLARVTSEQGGLAGGP
jgi:hypothetical protein